MPIFSLLIGLKFLPHERVGAVADRRGLPRPRRRCVRRRRHARGRRLAVIGTLAVVLASVFYASAGIYSQLHLKGTISGPVLATGSMLAGGVILLPLAILDPPTSMPTAGAIGSLLLLALLGTALAQLLLFRVVGLFGARRLSLVTYLLPGFALVYGALILDERVNGSALIGLALILLGVALGSGSLRLGAAAACRRRETTPTVAGLVERSDQDAERGRRRAAAPDELCRLVEVDAAVECEDEGRVTVEADGDQLLDPPAEHAGGRVGRRLLGCLGLDAPGVSGRRSCRSPLTCLGPILLLHEPRGGVRGRFRMSELEGFSCEAVPLDPRREPLSVTHRSALLEGVVLSAPRCIGRMFGNLASGLRRCFSRVKNVCR